MKTQFQKKLMRVLVTGANGFIGKTIVSELRASGHQVVQVGSPRSGNSLENFENEINYSIDLTDLDEVNSLKTAGIIDVVIHCAGLAHQFRVISKEQFWKVNVSGTENICKLATEISARHFILISSVAVYGKFTRDNSEYDEFIAPKPIGNYSESKYESELVARKICGESNIPLTILRPSTVIGEGDPGNVARLIRAIDKRRFFWLGRGENSKSFIYKKDVAIACLALLDRSDAETAIFNLSAKPIKMRRFVSFIEDALKKKAPPIYFPIRIVRMMLRTGKWAGLDQKLRSLNETVEKWVCDDVYLADNIKENADFEPSTSIRTAIGLEVAWYLQNK